MVGSKENVRDNVQHTEPMQSEPQLNWRQVAACLSANTINFAVGFGLSYTSSLIPALQDPNSDIQATLKESAWLASSTALVAPVGAILAGFLMEHVGRLVALQLSVLPFCIAWIVMATAHSFTALLVGRILTGIAYTAGVTAAAVLTTETALKNYRGSFQATGPALVSFGTLCEYTLGAVTDWRTNAWISLISPLLSFVLIFIFTAESPIWLKTRGRTESARKASQYYYGDPDYVVLPTGVPQTPPPLQTDLKNSGNNDLEKSGASQKQEPTRLSFSKQVWMLLTVSSGYKPLIILTVVFFLQQWSGIYITLYYAVTFYQEAGVAMDSHIAAIMNGAMRVIGTVLTVFLLGRCGRRILMLVSAIGMTITMAASAYSTGLALTERSGGPATIFPSWFPVACIVTYILAAAIGLQTIPWTMASELFPQRVRGAAQSVNMVMSHIFMFASLQIYPTISSLGGSVGVQYLFSGVSLLAAIVVWIFYPETQGKTLSEIEDYFVHNTIYLGKKKL